MIWRYHPEAAEELLEASKYYLEISPELARSFVANVEEAIEKILHAPGTWPVVDDGVRRFLVRRFPYGIYYTLVDGETTVLVLAVMHMRRHSENWRGRLT